MLLTIGVLAILSGCKKESTPEYFHVTGVLKEDCSGTPCANCKVYVIIEGNSGWDYTPDRTITRYTDSSGKFGISAPKDNLSNYTAIRFSSNRSIIVESCDQDIGEIVKRPTANYALRIIIPPKYLDTDTLYYPHTFQLHEKIKIPCSVRDTILPPVYNFSSSSYAPLDNKNLIKPINKGFYSVYRIDSLGFYRDVSKGASQATMEVEGCTGRLDTVTVFIE